MVPQFVPRGASVARRVLLLTVVHILLAGIGRAAWAFAGGALGRTLEGGRRVVDLVAGVALRGLAARLTLT